MRYQRGMCDRVALCCRLPLLPAHRQRQLLSLSRSPLLRSPVLFLVQAISEVQDLFHFCVAASWSLDCVSRYHHRLETRFTCSVAHFRYGSPNGAFFGDSLSLILSFFISTLLGASRRRRARWPLATRRRRSLVSKFHLPLFLANALSSSPAYCTARLRVRPATLPAPGLCRPSAHAAGRSRPRDLRRSPPPTTILRSAHTTIV
jgi:hypothetical protein